MWFLTNSNFGMYPPHISKHTQVMLSILSFPSPSNSKHDNSPKKTNSSIFIISKLPKLCTTSLHLPCLLLLTIILQFLIISSFFRRHPSPPSTTQTALELQRCKYGKVFVYDLPPLFNQELLDNCHELDPWSSRCVALSNGGFGPLATGLDAVIPKNLTPAWYTTDKYNGEVIYHRRMMDYTCRTTNPAEATGFYIPFYAGLAVVKYLWSNFTAKERDQHGEMVLEWLKDQPSWKRFNGADHFIMLGRLTWAFRRLTDNDSDWGSGFMYKPLMKNVLRLSTEKTAWDDLEISVPYPTAFHPRSDSDIHQWQRYVRAQQRTSVFCVVGASRGNNDFESLLMDYSKSESGSASRVVDCSVIRCNNSAPEILESFLDSDFCLQPRGDGSTRRSFFDCMLAGSIPVYFWKESFDGQYQWHVKFSGRTSSVFIDHNDVRNDISIIKKVLEGYSKEQVRRMREIVIDMIPRFLYSFPSQGLDVTRDAFDLAVEGVLRKFRRQSLQQIASI